MTAPSNAELADLLERYGRLLEIAGESSFRVRAYERAAQAIRSLAEPVAAMAQANRLREIEGVGEGIAAALIEVLTTGRLQALIDLEQRVPPTLLEVLEVPGVGAKTAARLFTELGIVDLAGLEAAAEAGRIRQLQGLSGKTEAKILAGIGALKRRTGRHRLGVVLPFARRLVAELQEALPHDSAVSLAGSVRRMEETVADVDLVIACPDPAAAIQAIERHPSIHGQGERWQHGVRFNLDLGLPLDVLFADRVQFGTALVQATGSRAHLELLGALPIAATEEGCYDALGLPWIPPELRQGLDEVDLARADRLGTLVTVADVGGEFHCHTTWSDGMLSVAEMVNAAAMRGYRFLGISDHTHSLGVAHGLDVTRLHEQGKEIAAANARGGIRVFAGAEVEVARDGHLDFSDDVLADLDVVIASTHVGLRQPRAELTARLLSVLANPHVDIIAHPSGRLIEQREGGDFDWECVFAAAARSGTALEINADPARLDLSAQLARQALAAGCLLTINCDAHQPASWSNLEYGIAIARRAGATPQRVLNCWQLPEIEAWLRDRGATGARRQAH